MASLISEQQPPEPPRRGRGPGRPSTLDRPTVLNAAWSVIADRGLDRARYADIARASATPVSTLQNAFGTLEALLTEALDYAGSRDEAFLASIPSAEQAGPLERLEAFVGGGVGAEYGVDSWLVWLERWRAAARDHTPSEHTARAYERWWTIAESIVLHGQSTGDFTRAAPSRDLALGVVAILDGCAVALVLPARHARPEEARRIALASVTKLLAV